MLTKANYYAEARWVKLLVDSPGYSPSEPADAALRDAALIASQFGYINVAEWIKSRLAK